MVPDPTGNIEREMYRQANKLGAEIFKPAVVTTINDIKQLLYELDPSKAVSSTSTVSAQLDGETEEGGAQRFNVSTVTTSQPKRSILLHGFEIIKKRIEYANTAQTVAKHTVVNGRIMQPAVAKNQESAFSTVDKLVERWLGGKRDGLLIRWDLRDGYTYKYDIWQHKLTRVKHE